MRWPYRFLLSMLGSALVACANSSTDEVDSAAPPTDTGAPSDAIQDAGADRSSADVATPDADYDPTGTPCNPQLPSTYLLQSACGQCGTRVSACLAADPDASDTTYAYGSWGPCSGELTGPNNCDPFQTYPPDPDAGVNACYTVQRPCRANCTFGSLTYLKKEDAQCEPGYTQYVGSASCTAGYRTRTCTSACHWDPYGDCEDGMYTLEPADTIGGMRHGIFDAIYRRTFNYGGGCDAPESWVVGATSDYTYAAVRLTNPGTNVLYVYVTFSNYLGPEPPVMNTSPFDLVFAYQGSELPSDLSTCEQAVTLSQGQGGLYNLPIPAGGSIVLFIARSGTERASAGLTVYTANVVAP